MDPRKLKQKAVERIGRGSKREYRVSGPQQVQHKVLVNAQLEWKDKDEFRLEKPPIGKGAFGSVYKASHASGFQLAIKVINFSGVVKGILCSYHT